MNDTAFFFAWLRKHGLRHIVIAPGSRSAPLVLGLQAAGFSTPVVAADERCAGYIALGMAENLLEPVAVITTSGSAVQNLGPAMAEAFYRNIPLMAITADRPPERIGQEEGQSLPQNNLFREISAATFSLHGEMNTQELTASLKYIRKALRLGPVHVNYAFREPLYLAPKTAISIQQENIQQVEKKGEMPIVSGDKKILIIAGQLHPQDAKELLPITKSGIPVVADICSNLPGALGGIGTIAAQLPEALLPDEVWITGHTLIWRKWGNWLSKNPRIKVVEIRPDGRQIQRFPNIPSETIHTEFREFAGYIQNLKPDAGYLNLWKTFYHKFQQIKQKQEFRTNGDVFAVQELLRFLDKNDRLHLSNSLSVRYADLINFEQFKIPVYSNRGVSGIDGCLSSAVGHALVEPQKTHWLLIGDQALAYDNNGLWVKPIPKNLRIVVLNNGGGQIFRMIDGPSSVPNFKQLFLNEEKKHFAWLANRYELEYCHSTPVQFGEILKKNTQYQLIELQTDAEASAMDFKQLTQCPEELSSLF